MSRPTARDKILEAAAEVARAEGAANLSLDAVAAKAGVSKGGLLYHFPTKAALMRASVEFFIDGFEARLEAATSDGAPLLKALVELTLEECGEPKPGAASLAAAIAENPDFLRPVKHFQQRLLKRLLASSPEPAQALIVYLALEGLRSQQFFETELDADEAALARQALLDCCSKFGPATSTETDEQDRPDEQHG